MKKIIGKIVNWILVCGLLITMIPVVTKADSTYTRIMPGYTSDLATTIPVEQLLLISQKANTSRAAVP